MPRLLPQMLEEDGPEDEAVTPPGLFDDEDAAPAESPYAALLKAPAPVAAPRPAAGGAPQRGRASRDYTAELAEAQGADADAQRKADFESGLDTMAFRRPVAARQVGTPNASALMQRMGLERQGRQDAGAEALNAARISKLGQEKPGADKAAQDELMRARAEEIRRKAAKADAGDGAADEDLEAFRGSMSKVLGKDLSGMSRKSIEALAKHLGADKQLAERRAARAAAEAAKAAKDGAAAKKGAEKDATLFLRGYRLRPDARPRATEAEHIRKAQASTDTIDASVRELEGIYRKYGTSVLPGDVRARAEALTTDLQLSMKGPEQYALGVLAGPDMGLLEKTIPNPTGVNATLLDFFSGDQNVLARYAALRSQAKRRFEDKARALGYERGETEPEPRGYRDATARTAVPPGASLDAPAIGGTVRVSNGKETLEIPAADVADAEKDGFRRVR